MKKNLFYAAALTALFAACDNDIKNEGPDFGEPVMMNVTAQISNVQTRASGTTWTSGDKIGISGTTGATAYDNVLYSTTEGDGNFTIVEEEGNSPIYFQSNEAATFTAYYPYSEGTEAITADTREQANQSEFDFLYAEYTVNEPKKDPTAKFQFSHRMSQLVLNVKAGNDVNSDHIKTAQCALSNHIYDGTFNRTKGTANALPTENGMKAANWIFANNTENADYNAPYSETTGAEGNAHTYTLILFPQTVKNGAVFSITIDGNTFNAQLKTKDAEDLTLGVGLKYIYNITVNKTNLDISKATIQSWGDGNGADGDNVDAVM